MGPSIPYEVFAEYRSFRNNLRRLSFDESVYVLWRYTQNLRYGDQIPDDIQVEDYFKKAKNYIEKSVYPWEVENLFLELILNCDKENIGTESLKSWGYFSKTINKQKHLSNTIAKHFLGSDFESVLFELHKIAHQQFPWQSDLPSDINMLRYYKLYSSTGMEPIISTTFNMNLDEFYRMALALFGFYRNKVALNYPPRIEIKKIKPEHMEEFTKHFSTTLEEFKKQATALHALDRTYGYNFGLINLLDAFPLIRMDYEGKDSLVCALSTRLYWMFTRGVYYQIREQKNFDSVYGKAFEDYIGHLLQTSLPTNLIIPEQVYNKGKNKSTDWFVIDSNSNVLFVECKTKRITQSAKMEFSALNEQLEKMAEFLLQLYKGVHEYSQGKYPSIYPVTHKSLYPLLVTLEEWYPYGDLIIGELNKILEKLLKEEGIPQQYLENFPYSICSANEFETLSDMSKVVGFEKILKAKTNSREKRLWNLETLIKTDFHTELESSEATLKDEAKKLMERLVNSVS